MKALFICDEKEEWNLLRNIFHAHFPKIELICTLKGDEALHILTYEGPVGMVIIECSVKDNEPTQLAQQIIDQSGERPILFVGTPTMIKDRIKDNFYNNYDMVSIYHKPYQAEEFKDSIQQALDWAKKEEFESSIVELDPENFLPLKLRNFYLYDHVPFDVYVELTKTKFIKAISANRPYTQSTIQDFQKRNIRVLYLEKNEHLNFLENSIKKITNNLYNHPNDENKKRMQTMIAGVLVIHQYIKDVGVSDNLTILIEQIYESIPKCLAHYESILDLILDYPMEQADLAEQAVLKILIADFLAVKMGWTSGHSRLKLTLSGVLHDAFLPKESWSTITYKDHPDLDHLSEEQKLSFINHPKRAAEMARQFNKFPDVDFIIEEHHELPDGNGFPQGLHANKITKISAIFILTNNFVIQLVSSGISKSTIKNTLDSFEAIYSIGNYKDTFKLLNKGLRGKN